MTARLHLMACVVSLFFAMLLLAIGQHYGALACAALFSANAAECVRGNPK